MKQAGYELITAEAGDGHMRAHYTVFSLLSIDLKLSIVKSQKLQLRKKTNKRYSPFFSFIGSVTL